MTQLWWQAERFGIFACATACLWGTCILKERDRLSYLTWCAWCCCLQGEVCQGRRSSKCVSGHYPQAGEVWCWELDILYQPLNLQMIFSTSVYHYFTLKGKETNITLDEKTQNVKEGSLCSEWDLTGDLLPRVKRKWKPCSGYYFLKIQLGRLSWQQVSVSWFSPRLLSPQCSPLLPDAVWRAETQ